MQLIHSCDRPCPAVIPQPALAGSARAQFANFSSPRPQAARPFAQAATTAISTLPVFHLARKPLPAALLLLC
jgi:hypothetical protein